MGQRDGEEQKNVKKEQQISGRQKNETEILANLTVQIESSRIILTLTNLITQKR